MLLRLFFGNAIGECCVLGFLCVARAWFGARRGVVAGRTSVLWLFQRLVQGRRSVGHTRRLLQRGAEEKRTSRDVCAHSRMANNVKFYVF